MPAWPWLQTRAATDELLTLPWPLLPDPDFVVSAGTHGLTDALVSTNTARRDDACPDAAGLLSLLDASKWLRRPRPGAVRPTPSLASAFSLVLLIQIVVQIVQIKSSVLSHSVGHISKVQLFKTFHDATIYVS